MYVLDPFFVLLVIILPYTPTPPTLSPPGGFLDTTLIALI